MKITSVRNAIVRLELGNSHLVQDSLVEFGNGDLGIVRQSDSKHATAVLLKQGRVDPLRTSTSVTPITEKYSVRVSDKLLGMLLDATGKPLLDIVKDTPLTNFKYDSSFETRLVDTNKVILTDRMEVNRPLRTGVFMVDTLIPIGRGQRELVLGDKGTGKTWLGVQTIIQNKDDTRLRFIYCAIGKTSQEVNNVIAELRKNNAVERTVVVAAFLDDTDAAQYYSAYLATTIADHFREQGLDVFIVYDDLTKHGDAYRSLSIQTGQTPGREAFPGDIFYSHSRLLERSGAFVSGGTITSFPIIETVEENNASYLATNIISISDGQVMMSADKYNTNVLPAINYGPSVSRIGSSSQPYFIRQIKSYLIQLFSGYENNSYELKINVVNTNKFFLQNILNGYVISALFRQAPNQLLSFEHQWLLTVLVQKDCIMFLENVDDIVALRDVLVNKVFTKDERILRVFKNIWQIKSRADLQVCEELLVSIIKPFISSYLRAKYAHDNEKLKEILEHYEGYNYTLSEAASVKLAGAAAKKEADAAAAAAKNEKPSRFSWGAKPKVLPANSKPAVKPLSPAGAPSSPKNAASVSPSPAPKASPFVAPVKPAVPSATAAKPAATTATPPVTVSKPQPSPSVSGMAPTVAKPSPAPAPTAPSGSQPNPANSGMAPTAAKPSPTAPGGSQPNPANSGMAPTSPKPPVAPTTAPGATKTVPNGPNSGMAPTTAKAAPPPVEKRGMFWKSKKPSEPTKGKK